MAIQNRRGAYVNFDPTKMKPGEFAIVQSGDPNSTDGKAVYICTQTGTVRRLVSELELGDLVDDIMAEELATKVDKVTGMGLSTNNYTNADKEKLTNIETGANKTILDPTLTQQGQAADAAVIGTALNNLRNAVNIWQDYPYSEFTIGEYVVTADDGLGNFAVKASRARTGLIPCHPGEVHFTGLNTNLIYNCFYDASKNAISNFGIFANRGYFNVPDGAAYFAISGPISDMEGLRLSSQNIDAVKASADDAVQTAMNTESELLKLSTVTTTDITLWNMVTSAGMRLNNETTVFSPLTLVIPANSMATLTIESKAAGALNILLFTKNTDGTYKYIRTVSSTIVVGNNTIDFFVDDNTYIGFYTTEQTISYATSGTEIPIYHATYADVGNNTVFTYSSDMEWHFGLSYKKGRSEQSAAIVTVKKDGTGKYADIISAVNNEPENTPIFVFPGIYEQDMTRCLKKRIVLIGTDRNTCIIRNTDGRYGHHALYISCGYFDNLTIEEPYIDGESQEIGDTDSGGYAVHIDTDEDYGIGKKTEFRHCTISSDFFPAVGLGMRKDAHYVFDDCLLINGQIIGRGNYSDRGGLGALFFHDSNGEQGDQFITVKNCVLKSKLQYAMCPSQANRVQQNNKVYCNFINNVLYSESGRYSDTVWFRRDPFNPETGIFRIVIGVGNSNASLNNN